VLCGRILGAQTDEVLKRAINGCVVERWLSPTDQKECWWVLNGRMANNLRGQQVTHITARSLHSQHPKGSHIPEEWMPELHQCEKLKKSIHKICHM
jgi:hypothetical protein